MPMHLIKLSLVSRKNQNIFLGLWSFLPTPMRILGLALSAQAFLFGEIIPPPPLLPHSKLELPQVGDPLYPCYYYLSYDSYNWLTAGYPNITNCTASPPGGKLSFRPDIPSGTQCQMTLCEHFIFGPGYKDYALGINGSPCCPFVTGGSQYAQSSSDQWTCTLVNMGGRVLLDCQTGNADKWKNFQGCCSIFSSIPSTSNCGNWAPNHDEKPGSCATGCCIVTEAPCCTV